MIPSIEHTTYIRASARRVYEMLTTGAGWDAWFTDGTIVDARLINREAAAHNKHTMNILPAVPLLSQPLRGAPKNTWLAPPPAVVLVTRE